MHTKHLPRPSLTTDPPPAPPHPHTHTYPLLLRYSKFVKRDLHPAEHSGLGAVAGAVTGLLTTPLDVLKTRLMLQGASGGHGGTSGPPCGGPA